MAIVEKILNLFILRNKWATTFVIASMLLLSAAVIAGLHTNLEKIEENRLQYEVNRVKGLVLDRIEAHINSLVAVRGLFSLEGEPLPIQFQHYVAEMLWNQNNSKNLSIGYSKFFPNRTAGRTKLEVWPKSALFSQSSIILLEPLNERNEKLLGYDMLTEDTRREAMFASIETGTATVSRPVAPVLNPQEGRNVLIIYLPFFGKGNSFPKTAAERRAKIKGFLFAPILTKDFFQQAFTGVGLLDGKIKFSLDALQDNNESVHLFSHIPEKADVGEDSSSLTKSEVFDVKNQRWVLKASPTTSLLSSSERTFVWTAWASVFILIAIVLYIVKKTQLFMIEEEKRKKLLLDASLAKSNFLANMSHEIRTPLGAIVGFADIICREEISPEKKQSYVTNIEKNVQLVTHIIDDVLDNSRIEAGKLPIEKRTLSLPHILSEVEFVMSLQAKKNEDLKFTVSSRGLVPEKIISDEIRLKQILMNLVGNALKFTKRGSVSLTVQCPVHPITGARYLEFLIEDTGIGISYEVQNQLFAGFVQGDASTTRRYGGTGLGLALSKKLANLLGGDTELVKSAPGVGSIFRVKLPINKIENQRWLTDWRDVSELNSSNGANRTKVSSSNASSLYEKKILLVEDSEDNQEIFKMFLESVGAQIDIVDNGVGAVRQVQNKKYDLILMDIQLPGIDGKEATRRIRSIGFRNPIIALTAHAMPREIESCMLSGCSGQITKPVTCEQLIRETESYL
jgi:signal transduction histidine kinase/CheY-like chemotaxis protein